MPQRWLPGNWAACRKRWIFASAYVTLAKNAEQSGDVQSACAYATVVVSLFDDEALCAEAKRILAAHPEAAK